MKDAGEIVAADSETKIRAALATVEMAAISELEMKYAKKKRSSGVRMQAVETMGPKPKNRSNT